MKRFKVPCFRPNLFYDVQFRDIMRDEFEDVKDFAIASLGGDGWEENRDRGGGGDSMDIWNLFRVQISVRIGDYFTFKSHPHLRG